MKVVTGDGSVKVVTGDGSVDTVVTGDGSVDTEAQGRFSCIITKWVRFSYENYPREMVQENRPREPNHP